MSHQAIYVDNDNVFTLKGLKDQVTDTFVNDADVALTITDELGVAVGPSGFSWPQTMNYVIGSNGNYQVTIDKVIEISGGGSYVAVVVVNGSGIADGKWEVLLRGTIRRS